MTVDAQLTVFFVKTYNDLKQQGRLYVPNTVVATYCLINIYNKFISEGVIIPIEQLDREHKERLVSECRATGESFTNQSLITRSKILHLINTINSNT